LTLCPIIHSFTLLKELRTDCDDTDRIHVKLFTREGEALKLQRLVLLLELVWVEMDGIDLKHDVVSFGILLQLPSHVFVDIELAVQDLKTLSEAEHSRPAIRKLSCIRNLRWSRASLSKPNVFGNVLQWIERFHLL
jgi:hypothetical protein